MEKKAQISEGQLQEVDAYLGKLVRSQSDDAGQLCPTCVKIWQVPRTSPV